MKRQHFLTLLLASFFVIVAFNGGHVYAQNSIAGDSVCGRWDPTLNGGKGAIVNPCGVDSLKIVTQGIFKFIIGLGLPLLVVMIIYRFVMAWYSWEQGNVNAYKEAGKKATEGIIGFLIIVALFGGITLAMLKYFGVKDGTGGGFNPLRLLQSISLIEIPHAYAATAECKKPALGDSCTFILDGVEVKGNVNQIVTSGLLLCENKTTHVKSQDEYLSVTDCSTKADGTSCRFEDYYHTMGVCSGGTAVAPAVTSPQVNPTSVAPVTTSLPNPLGFDSLYDFILGALNTVMKFFLYPAMIGIWVWSGFLYVAAQGAPEKLKKAHNLLLWAFITTLIVFTTQGFLTAMKGSVNKIIPNTITTNTAQDTVGAVDTNTTVGPIGTIDGRVPPKDNTYGAVCTMTDGSGRIGTLGADKVTCYPGRGGGTLPTTNTSAAVPQAQVLTPVAKANTTTICSSLSSASQQMSCFRGKVCDLIISQSEQAFCLAVKAQVDPAIYASQTCGLIVSESDRETCRIVQLKAKNAQ